MTLSFPPFSRAVIWLLSLNTAVFLLMLLFPLVGLSRWIGAIFDTFGLVPVAVFHGWIWQIVTYSLVHAGFWHWFGNMIGIWMFGSAIEGSWGTRRFLELFGFGVIGAALTTLALSYTVLGNPHTPTVGASGGVFAILIAFGIVFAENEIMMIPFPAAIKAKYFVAILIIVELAFAMSGGGNVAYIAHLGGLFFGYVYVRWFAYSGRARSRFDLSETFYGLRNSFYRWKRRRAAKKFEVYMREHDRKVTFDEHGNYVPPEDQDKTNGGGKSGWVN